VERGLDGNLGRGLGASDCLLVPITPGGCKGRWVCRKREPKKKKKTKTKVKKKTKKKCKRKEWKKRGPSSFYAK